MRIEEATAPSFLELATSFQSWAAADESSMNRAINRASFDDVIGVDPALESQVAIGYARLFMMSGRYSSAHLMLRRRRRYMSPPLLQTQSDALLATIETALGRPQAALHLLDGYAWGIENGSRKPEADFRTAFLAATARAYAYMSLEDLKAAESCVSFLLSNSGAGVGRMQVVEGTMCAALIAYLRRDDVRAIEMLDRALRLAGDDIRLPIVQLTDKFAPLLARHPTIADQWPQVPYATGDPELNREFRQPLPDSLTDRERTVLRFLTTNMSTEEIAGEMFVSINTVKTHIAAIYRKLAAKKRREAVMRARELELL
jgi:LuxR family transcriptional regulator, maltose regulon positive regulatory protein